MTDNDLRIKVAELRGWTRIGPGHDCVNGRQVDVLVGYTPKNDPDDRVTVIPDYPKDLNACHEFEGTLTYNQCSRYEDVLLLIWKRGTMYCHADAMRCHITARQRCEAFVETMEAK
jgi:hypothetical protein